MTEFGVISVSNALKDTDIFDYVSTEKYLVGLCNIHSKFGIEIEGSVILCSFLFVLYLNCFL